METVFYKRRTTSQNRKSISFFLSLPPYKIHINVDSERARCQTNSNFWLTIKFPMTKVATRSYAFSVSDISGLNGSEIENRSENDIRRYECIKMNKFSNLSRNCFNKFLSNNLFTY